MRIVRLFFATLTGIWLSFALLRLFAAFSRPNALSYAIGYTIIPLILFSLIAFGGRPSRRRGAMPKSPDSKNAVASSPK